MQCDDSAVQINHRGSKSKTSGLPRTHFQTPWRVSTLTSGDKIKLKTNTCKRSRVSKPDKGSYAHFCLICVILQSRIMISFYPLPCSLRLVMQDQMNNCSESLCHLLEFTYLIFICLQFLFWTYDQCLFLCILSALCSQTSKIFFSNNHKHKMLFSVFAVKLRRSVVAAGEKQATADYRISKRCKLLITLVYVYSFVYHH